MCANLLRAARPYMKRSALLSAPGSVGWVEKLERVLEIHFTPSFTLGSLYNPDAVFSNNLSNVKRGLTIEFNINVPRIH